MRSAFGVEHGEISKAVRPPRGFNLFAKKKQAKAPAPKPARKDPFAMPSGRLPWEKR